MKYRDCMYGWNPVERMYDPCNPKNGKVLIGPHPDKSGWSVPYDFTAGACMLETKNLTGNDLVARIFIDFNTMVVRDGINPYDAHREFLKIDEYREYISPDTEGVAQ